MDSKILALIVIGIIAVAGISVYVLTGGNGGNGNDDPVDEFVIDAAGRQVSIPDNLNNGIVTIGSSGPLRFVSLFDVYDHVIEVDKGDVTDNKNGRAYSYAYAYDKIDSYHADNALDSATVESIAKKNPSLVVTSYSLWNNNLSNFQTLASTCTVLVLNNQDMKVLCNEDGILADYFKGNVEMLGKIFKMEKRASEAIKGIESTVANLISLSKTSGTEVYVAGVTINGSNTLNTTFPVYLPLDLIGAENAYNGDSTASKVVLNVEDLKGMDIGMIVIDPSSSDKMKETDSQYVMQYIYGINNDSTPDNDIPLYVTTPIVWDSINYDCALASAYYLEHLLYGTLTHEQVVEKINGIFKTFYGDNGSNVLKDMSAFFVKKSSDNGVELPLLSEVEIVNDGGVYLIKAAQ